MGNLNACCSQRDTINTPLSLPSLDYERLKEYYEKADQGHIFNHYETLTEAEKV